MYLCEYCEEGQLEMCEYLKEHFLERDCPAETACPKFKERKSEENGVVVCSECGAEHEWEDYRASFCEDCGAKMEG